MSDRVQVGDLQGPEGLRPQATPVDTYHQPGVQPPSGPNSELLDLANALKEINPSLNRFIGDHTYDVTKADLEAGAALRAKNQKDWNAAIKSGAIPAGASPWFQKGYQRQDMKAEALKYDAAIKLAYTKSSARTSDDPEALKAFTQGFSENWMKQSGVDQNPEFTSSFAPLMSQTHSHLVAIHSQDRSQATEAGMRDSFQTLIAGTVAANALYTSPENVAASIKASTDDAIAHGLDATEANRLSVDAIAQQAVADGDTTHLDLMDKIKSGSGPLGGSSYAKEKRMQAENAIFARQRQIDSYESTHGAKIKDEKLAELQMQTHRALLKDPQADIGAALTAAITIDPEHGPGRIWALKEHALIPPKDDPSVVASLRYRISTGEASKQDIYDARGNISPDTLTRMYDDKERLDNSKGVLDLPEIKVLSSNIFATVKGDPFNFDATKESNAGEAHASFIQDMVDFSIKHPQASRREIRDEANKSRESILKTYGLTSNTTDATLKKAGLGGESASKPDAAPSPRDANVKKAKEASVTDYLKNQGKP